MYTTQITHTRNFTIWFYLCLNLAKILKNIMRLFSTSIATSGISVLRFTSRTRCGKGSNYSPLPATMLQLPRQYTTISRSGIECELHLARRSLLISFTSLIRYWNALSRNMEVELGSSLLSIWLLLLSEPLAEYLHSRAHPS